MKCQKCSKQATLHITEIIKGKPHELHLCEEHARVYLTQEESEPGQPSPSSSLSQAFKKAASAQEQARLDQRTCPVCGISFLEFRNHGRLGCPHDYDEFRDELLPLLENVHGEARHCGKVPKRAPRDSKRQTELIRLRNELKRAVAEEHYEEAAELRDRIRKMEEHGGA